MSGKAVQHFKAVEKELVSFLEKDIKITQVDRITGGDINEAYGLTLTDGTHVFLKKNTKENASFFVAEEEGLAAIAKTGVIGTPKVLGSGMEEEGSGYSFLLMEFIEGGRRILNYWETFAHQLAAMHQAAASDLIVRGNYGFSHNNYIGSGKQLNTEHDNWITFFRDCRLEPQFKDAAGYFEKTILKKMIRLLDHLDDILVEPEHPSLLHGDLWSGNVITGNDGKAWLIDPAVYVGHAEADIAMTELFGGFPASFYDAYKEAAPFQPGYEHRRDLYNLYHLLNHLNIFGGVYYSSVKRIVEKY